MFFPVKNVSSFTEICNRLSYSIYRLVLHQSCKNNIYRAHESRKDEERVKELFDAIEKLRNQFESVERPILERESPTAKTEALPSEKKSESEKKSDGTPLPSAPVQGTEVSKPETDELPKSPSVKTDQLLDHEAELAKLESEFGNVNQDYSAEEIGDWEFDELEREFVSGNSATK